MLSRQTGIPCAGADDPRLRLVHRLDKDTSGVMLFAKDIATQRHLSAQFQNNQVQKEYLALVAGRPTSDQGEIDQPIAPHPTQRDRMTVTKHGRVARTDWKVEKSMRRFALLRCFPRTGRTHQIRVHLKSVGLPLAVDPLYNPQPPDRPVGLYLSHLKRDYRPTFGEEERPLIARLTLHAEKITFMHIDGKKITIESPPPKDFRAAISQLLKL
jgi:23S rRNA pseudouridine955/2504/2580 synthase/23S rRNA pseudouridine1911/1915/1917 synthase